MPGPQAAARAGRRDGAGSCGIGHGQRLRQGGVVLDLGDRLEQILQPVGEQADLLDLGACRIEQKHQIIGPALDIAGQIEQQQTVKIHQLLREGPRQPARVRNYLSPDKPTIAKIVEDVEMAFAAENLVREADGKSPLKRPSRETIRREINDLGLFECTVAREGLEKARMKFAPVGQGLDVTRPLERVEMDEWMVDLRTLVAGADLKELLDDETCKALGLDDEDDEKGKKVKKVRMWLTVAICTTTRCILAMKLSPTPSARSAIQTIDMITRDKGVWADAVGALSPWNMSGTPEQIVTDCGSAFDNYDTRAAASDLGIDIMNAAGGIPELRARIERLFGTMSCGLMVRLTGRTFRNVAEKGSYDPDKRAAFDLDDLSEALVRWVIDVYHNKPHEGLGGETPAHCWNRLVERYGVAPMPSLKLRRLAMGTRLDKTVTKTGVTVLGVRYHSEELARWFMHAKSKDVRVRWYGEDLGAIAVELDGQWTEVPSVLGVFKGENAWVWRAALSEIRASVAAQKAVNEEVIFKALARLKDIDGAARARQGLLVTHMTAESLERAEDELVAGLNFDETPVASALQPAADGLGLELPTAASAGAEKMHSVAAYDPDRVSAPEDAISVSENVPATGPITGGPDADSNWILED